MYIEKLYHKKFKEPSPGIVDALLHTPPSKFIYFGVEHIDTYFTNIIYMLLEYDVHVGTKYGSVGIELKDFLHLPQQSDTIFEMCSVAYHSLSKQLKQQVSSRRDVILQDHSQVLYATKGKDTRMRYASGEAFGIPLWLLSTIANTKESNNLREFYISPTPKLALCLINKPRKFRLNMLEELYQQNLLDKTIWALSFDIPRPGTTPQHTPLDFVKTANHPFVKRFRHLLPKRIHIDTYKQCVWLPSELVGSCKWCISCETYENVHFATEKTFKAFLGCMVPLTVAPAGFNRHLEDMGFIMPGSYDHLSGNERIQAIAQILKIDHSDYTEVIKHNYDLITNTRAMGQLIADRIVAEYTQ